MIRYSYVGQAFEHEHREKAISLFGEMVADVAFDTVVVTGVSGLLMGPILAHRYQKNLAVVRKKDGAHSSADIEGWIGGGRTVFVDDFIASGATLSRVHNTLTKSLALCGVHWEWAGIFLWKDAVRDLGFKSPLPVSLPLYQIGYDRPIILAKQGEGA